MTLFQLYTDKTVIYCIYLDRSIYNCFWCSIFVNFKRSVCKFKLMFLSPWTKGHLPCSILNDQNLLLYLYVYGSICCLPGGIKLL